MKILFLTSLYPRRNKMQYGCFNHEMAKALAQHGCDIRILVPVARERTETLFLDNISITYFNYYGLGPFTRLINGSLIAYSVQKLLKAWNWYPNLIHAHYPLNEGEAARYLSHSLSIPYIIHLHSLDVFGERLKLRLTRHRTVYQDASNLICVSKATCQNLDSYGDSFSTKASIIHNGYNPDLFYPIHQTPTTTLRIITAANLITLKRHIDTLHALAILKGEGINFHLNLYEEGPERRRLFHLAQDLNLSSNITFHGSCAVSELAKAMRQSDLFILPSDYESFGCVYLEAVASSIPFICCDNCGILDIFPTATTIPPHDIHALVQAIRNYAFIPLFDPHPHTWKNQTKLIMALYHKILSRKS